MQTVMDKGCGTLFTCTVQLDCLLCAGLELSVTVTVAWNTPALANILETLEVLPETEPLQLYLYGGRPPEAEAVKVLLWPVVMVLGEVEQVTVSGLEELPKFIVKVRLPPLLNIWVAAGVTLVSGPGPPWL